MKVLHKIVNGEDPSDVSLSNDDRKLQSKNERRLSNNIGDKGAVDNNSKQEELTKMLQTNQKMLTNMKNNI